MRCFPRWAAPTDWRKAGRTFLRASVSSREADPFKGGHPYVNQVFIAYAGGAALDGHDGWLTYCGPANGGLINLDSIEVDESMYPIIIESRGVRPDTQGFGKFEGAPGVECVFYPVDHAMTVIYAADGTTFPPKGVNGGLPAAGSWTLETDAGRPVG